MCIRDRDADGGGGGDDDDDVRCVFVARYRDGQRRILDDAVRVLDAAIGDGGGGDDDRRWRFRRARVRRHWERDLRAIAARASKRARRE